MPQLTGFAQFPDEGFDAKLYQELVQLHLAITNLDRNYGLATGADSYPSTEWASLGITGAFFLQNVSRIYVESGAAIAAGEAVNLYDAAGTLKARLAQANSANTMAMGIANNTVTGIGQLVEVIWLRGLTENIASLQPGRIYYLDETVAGRINSAAPVASGSIIQTMGMGVSANKFLIDISLNLSLVP